jgi:hypothetical protein
MPWTPHHAAEPWPQLLKATRAKRRAARVARVKSRMGTYAARATARILRPPVNSLGRPRGSSGLRPQGAPGGRDGHDVRARRAGDLPTPGS